MASSRPRIPRSILSLVLLLFITTALLLSSVQAQESPSASPSPSEQPTVASTEPLTPTPTVDPVTPTPDPAVPTTDLPTPTSALPTTTAAPIPSATPIFSTSDACVSCKSNYLAVYNCASRIPVNGNLTTISQVFPFYQCICPNDGELIDALQECSVCLRQTGQLTYLNRTFYNVTNQDVKAMKQACLETSDGLKVPNKAGGRWDMLLSAAAWGTISAMVLVLVPLGGL
ncbi:hypothetical protein BC939DRAFT_506968 [Gamsiella multidivaricata]|uniref:uncharacterized protein n=1 Tax=Gamsiella multidivaricata TaxID=101098 RepID=UPI00221E6DF1|nr:uncharacterized protein BC939DRAFT_506968 [Gamsiella multidivaricata]KAG0356521.1 hypothetical protein BGZ54_000699 [Gamsiella multidivaricata]KAI7817900.1 hypothetical protein BC939DRAFT_506968 [Gamsiella multidivaricata]